MTAMSNFSYLLSRLKPVICATMASCLFAYLRDYPLLKAALIGGTAGAFVELLSHITKGKSDSVLYVLFLWLLGVGFLYIAFDDLKKSIIIALGFFCFQLSLLFLPAKIQNLFYGFYKQVKEFRPSQITQKPKDNDK